MKNFRLFLMSVVSAFALAMTGACASIPTVSETREEICKRKALAVRAAQATIAAFDAVCPFDNVPDESATNEIE